MSQTATLKCRSCGAEVSEEEALYRGCLAKDSPQLKDLNLDWRQFAKCEDCDYSDYKNTYGGM